MANRILCPPCYFRIGGEEKCCTHGCGQVTCTECGAVRDPEHAEPWSCTGFMYEPVDQAPGPATGNASKGDE